jgi:hypothetical protein
MGTLYLKLLLFALLSATFFVGAFLTHESYPREITLWIPLFFFGTVFALLALGQAMRVTLIKRERPKNELME